MKGMREIIAGVVLVMLLASCATAYQKSGLTGGYGESRIDDSHYVVYFNGNGYTNKDRVWYFWVYRCAQLTKEKGFSYFSIEPIQSGMKKTAFIPEQGERLYAAVLDDDADGRLINVSHGGGGYRTIYIPGSTIVSWHSKAIVAMYNVEIPQRTVVWRAQSVLDILAAYIKANGSSTPPQRSAIMEESAYAVGPEKQIVNIHQYLLAHPGSLVAADPEANRQGIAPSPSGPSEAPAALPALSSPAVSTNAATSSMAQAVANQLGCSTVRADANARFVASCGAYDLLIGCDGGQCRPLHTVKNKPDE